MNRRQDGEYWFSFGGGERGSGSGLDMLHAALVIRDGVSITGRDVRQPLLHLCKYVRLRCRDIFRLRGIVGQIE